MKYRVVLYNDNGDFKEVKIVDTIDEVKTLLKTQTKYEAYKCNDKSNNYTERSIISYELLFELKGEYDERDN